MKRTKKQNTTIKEVLEVVLYDLECLELKETMDNPTHYSLAIGNLKDILKGKYGKVSP